MIGFRDSNGKPAIIEDRTYTPAQGVRRTWELLTTYIDVMSYPPTLHELVQLSGYGMSTVRYHLRLLEDEERIVIVPHTARGIRVLDGGE